MRLARPRFLALLALLLLPGCKVDSWVASWMIEPLEETRLAPVPLRAHRRIPPRSHETVLRGDAQLLREVFRVVLLREPANAGEFNAYLSPIAQGGSIEGVYNGIVYSGSYKQLEETAP